MSGQRHLKLERPFALNPVSEPRENARLRVQRPHRRVIDGEPPRSASSVDRREAFGVRAIYRRFCWWERPILGPASGSWHVLKSGDQSPHSKRRRARAGRLAFPRRIANFFPRVPSKLCCFALALGCGVGVPSATAAGFADAVIGYNPGAGFATEFGTGLGFTNVAAVLGEPSRLNPGPFGGPTDPFNPPFLRDQLLSIGAAGSLTVRFDTPILNLPGNPFGLDFIIFGNSGFIITNANFSGGGITDGMLFGANSGQTRVSVSADNVTYFPLSPSLAPTVDGYFPVDGSGDFLSPVNPAIRGSEFSGRDLSGIRSLYAGSGGGAGFDLSWALDANGRNADLASVSFVRVEVLGGASEIDAFAVVVPEPATWTLGALGFTLLLAKSLRKSRKLD